MNKTTLKSITYLYTIEEKEEEEGEKTIQQKKIMTQTNQILR